MTNLLRKNLCRNQLTLVVCDSSGTDIDYTSYWVCKKPNPKKKKKRWHTIGKEIITGQCKMVRHKQSANNFTETVESIRSLYQRTLTEGLHQDSISPGPLFKPVPNPSPSLRYLWYKTSNHPVRDNGDGMWPWLVDRVEQPHPVVVLDVVEVETVLEEEVEEVQDSVQTHVKVLIPTVEKEIQPPLFSVYVQGHSEVP